MAHIFTTLTEAADVVDLTADDLAADDVLFCDCPFPIEPGQEFTSCTEHGVAHVECSACTNACAVG